MAYKSRLKTRLDRAIEELDNSVYVVEENGKKVNDTRNLNYPKNRINNFLEEGYRATQSKRPTTITKKKKEDEKRTWFSKGTFDDGYDFGDITKSILGTIGDVGVNAVHGIGSVVEGAGDLLTYGVAGVADILGADEFADFVKKETAKDEMGEFFNPAEEKLDKYSFSGERLDSLSQTAGELGVAAGLQTIGVPWEVTTGVTSFSSALSDAYSNDATDGEAVFNATVSAGAEILMNKLFGIPGVKISGSGKLGNKILGKFAGDMSNKAVSNLAKWGVGLAGEGFEEVATSFVQRLGQALSYEREDTIKELMENEDKRDAYINQLGEKLFGKEARDEYYEAGIGGAALGGAFGANHFYKTTKAGRDINTGYTQNEQTVIDSLVNEHTNTIAKQNALENELNKAIESKETEQGGKLSDKEKNALREQINTKIENGEIDISSTKVKNKEISAIREIVEEQMQKGELDTNKIESILGTTITENDGILARSYQETARKSENFTYDDAKVTNEQEKSVYDSAAKYFNNTTRSHEFVEKVAKISKEKGTKYGFINNEELQSLGHDIEGKQVNGLVRTNTDGEQTVLINIDSPKALNTIVGHETTHLLEGTQEYTDLQEAIFNYAKEQGDYNSRLDSLNSLYEGIDNANIDAELTADLVGDYLFTDEQFINSLSTNKPTVFQKIKDLIDDLVVRFTGTKEEKALREVQKKFKEAYKQINKIPEIVEPDVELKGIKFETKNYEFGGGIPDLVKTLENSMKQKQEYLNDLTNEMITRNAKKESTQKTQDADIKYSVSDNQGRTLTKEQQEYFKDSKVRDENGNLITAYHGTPYAGFNVFDERSIGATDEAQGFEGSYLGEGFYFTDDKVYADEYTDRYYDYSNPEIKEVYLNIKNPYIVPDNLDYDYGMLFDEFGVDNNKDLTKKLKELGYDGINYKDGTEYVAFYPNQIKNIDNTNPTSDADIRYSLTPDYGMSHRPSTDYGDASNFEENMPDVFEHPEWYMFGGDSWYKKAYKESWNALKKVRNNPDGEITIYRATIGDSFNEGDWVSPSKTYAEWHNYSNLEDKGKVIELKVKAKDIRFAGDDLNEFGYFPNGVDEYSLSRFNEQRAEAKGDYNVYGEDVKLAIAPLQEEIKELTESIKVVKVNLEAFKQDAVPVKETVTEDDIIQQMKNLQESSIKNQTERHKPLSDEFIEELTKQNIEWAKRSGKLKETQTQVEYTQPSKAELDNLMALQETGGTEYANTFFGLRDKYGQRKLYKGINEYKKAPETYEAPIKGDEFAPLTEADLPMLEQQYEEDFRNIDESSMPMETEENIPDTEMSDTKSLFETRDYEDVGNRKVNAYQYDNPEVKPFFQEMAGYMLNDLKSSIKGERGYNDQVYYESGGEEGFYGVSRQTTDDIAELLDGMGGKYKYTYADIEKGLNAIIKDEGSENNAVSKRIEFYLDQRLREGYTDMLGYEIPANQDYINLLKAREFDDFYNSLTIDDSMMPVENNKETITQDDITQKMKDIQAATIRNQTKNHPALSDEFIEELTKQSIEWAKRSGKFNEKSVESVSNSNISEKIAPAKEEYLAITPEKEPKLKRVKENPSYNEIAEILTEEPKTESDRNKRKWAIFKANVLDKGIVFEDLALKENNRELIAKWDYTLTSEARGQYAIGKGHNGSKSLDAIRQEVDNTGLTKDFYNYMYHKHNVDRMTLASRFEGMENKPVFGDSVTADVSQKIVNQYENQHPEFMDFAQDVYDYVNADKQLLVDNGVISQETADLWSEMYPHYVPTRRTTDTGIDINVPLDTRKTGINAPIKKATGGSADILPLFDTMAMRTLQTYRATAKNSFGVELMNTMGTTIESAETNVDEVIDSIDAQDGLLQEGKKGKNPTFTVFENGEKITFEITKDMYDALKPVSESSLLSKTIKPLNIAGNIRRGLLTEYNPTFMLTNAIKDTQDILLNSQHSLKTYAKIPEAHKQLLTKGYWYQEYIRNGGEQNSYFDNESNTFKTENKSLVKKIALAPLNGISKVNNYVEMIPRLAEYIASRQSGRSIEVSMLDAARVTTNFKAGGAVTKFANRNGATFLNASVQGAMQQVRNIREAKANGVRGWVNLATKFTMAALPAVLLNNLVWEDDEEYEELSDYVKQNYYVVGKNDDGTFIRIPKGRTVAVIQDAVKQMENLITGDDEADLKSFIDLVINNLAPNNPLDNNILSPIVQVAQNKAWYGGDLVPTRLQDLPKSEQYDESTDNFSKWLGEIFPVSPYKVNYLLDQYSGGVGDVLLPMITPEATSDAETIGGYLTAPFKSKFTTNSTMNNQNISDFYDMGEELTTNAKKSDATDKDVLSNKYMNSVKAEMNELYKEKREIQNSDLSKSEKYEQVLDIQSQINELAENALSEYSNVRNASNYSTVGDREYYKRINEDGEVEWTKVNDDEAEDLSNLGLTHSEKNTYFKTKSEISSIVEEYKDNKSDLDEDSDEYKNVVSELSNSKKADIVSIIKDTGFNDEQKAYLYKKYYNSDTIDTIVSSGINVDAYLDYSTQDIKADKDKDGDSIPNSRKKKVIAYVNGLDLSIPEKAILIKATNTFKFNDYNYQIIDYVSGLDISYDEKKSILEELDMKVLDDGTIEWE